MIDCEKVKKLALENGFKLKEQASGNLDLNSYVYDFAEALLKDKQAEIDSLKAQLAKVESGEFVIVPKEPTEKMMHSALMTVIHNNGDVKAMYKVMIEAAQGEQNEY